MTPIETLQPEQSGGWIEHDGKGMPVEAPAVVDFTDRFGWEGTANAWLLSWGDIVRYRLQAPAPSSEPQP